MSTLKEFLEESFVGRKVKITIGHPANNQHIVATCVGFKDGSGEGSPDWRDKMFILLKDITTNDHWLETPIEAGNYNKHYFRLDTEITILREENLNQLLSTKQIKEV